MPIFDRPLVISERPTLVDPLNGDDDEEPEEEPEQAEREMPRVLGEGGGRTVHGIEFEEDSSEIIKGANLVALLATGDEGESQLYREIFTNAAIQLERAVEEGKDISELTGPAEELNAHTIGVVWDEESDSLDSEADDSEDTVEVETDNSESDEETTEE